MEQHERTKVDMIVAHLGVLFPGLTIRQERHGPLEKEHFFAVERGVEASLSFHIHHDFLFDLSSSGVEDWIDSLGLQIRMPERGHRHFCVDSQGRITENPRNPL